MSAWEAVLLSAVAFGSMWACYGLGVDAARREMRERRERRQRWEEWDDED